MADEPRKTLSRRASLSYDQVRRMNPSFTDLMVKDYQGILQDSAFLADEVDNIDRSLTERIDDLEVRVDALEYRTYENISVTDNFEAGEFQIILCKNTVPIEITLKPEPLDGDEVSIIRTNSRVKLIGSVNNKTNLTLNVKGSGPKLVYDAIDETWWRI